jgi:hypothetical protein
VPTFTWGLVRSNLPLAMTIYLGKLWCLEPVVGRIRLS